MPDTPLGSSDPLKELEMIRGEIARATFIPHPPEYLQGLRNAEQSLLRALQERVSGGGMEPQPNVQSPQAQPPQRPIPPQGGFAVPHPGATPARYAQPLPQMGTPAPTNAQQHFSEVMGMTIPEMASKGVEWNRESLRRTLGYLNQGGRSDVYSQSQRFPSPTRREPSLSQALGGGPDPDPGFEQRLAEYARGNQAFRERQIQRSVDQASQAMQSRGPIGQMMDRQKRIQTQATDQAAGLAGSYAAFHRPRGGATMEGGPFIYQGRIYANPQGMQNLEDSLVGGPPVRQQQTHTGQGLVGQTYGKGGRTRVIQRPDGRVVVVGPPRLSSGGGGQQLAGGAVPQSVQEAANSPWNMGNDPVAALGDPMASTFIDPKQARVQELIQRQAAMDAKRAGREPTAREKGIAARNRHKREITEATNAAKFRYNMATALANQVPYKHREHLLSSLMGQQAGRPDDWYKLAELDLRRQQLGADTRLAEQQAATQAEYNKANLGLKQQELEATIGQTDQVTQQAMEEQHRQRVAGILKGGLNPRTYANLKAYAQTAGLSDEKLRQYLLENGINLSEVDDAKAGRGGFEQAIREWARRQYVP